ncbi:copper resistance protein CopC [Microbispora sp. NEAU-D428]|uniref:copper resistance CopC family protein n=1 Tax=Microbispora sitophila TaxID=2771537 RepID=UPI001867B265|nr:copper resistance CopC family protein [Microbispora sitophila]MBE3014206.1 copper resistance protein CopC [Microbispora sitophila]
MDQVARMCNDAPPTRGGRRTAGRTAPAPAAARAVPPRHRLRVLAVPPRGRLRLLAVPLLALLSVMLVATPARAHDVLVASDPKDGAVLDAVPASVTLTFDQAVRRDFARIAVTGPDGAHYEQGEITVDGRNVSVGVRPGTPAGAYAIGYRIVSNDGHPVTGAVKFSVTGGGAAPGAVTAPAATPAPGTANSGTGTTGTGTTGTGTTGQGGGSWVWGLLAVTAALLALCTRVLVRHDRRLRDGTIPAPPAAGTARAASATGPEGSGAEAAGASAADSGAEGPSTGRSAAAGTGAGSSPASGGAA